jgi:methyl-accepting chemotaxis protein
MMADGKDILREWQDAMQGLVATARDAAGRDLPKQLLGPMQRQLELLQELVERERRVQGELFGYLFTPVDAVFDLIEQSAGTFRKQSQALGEAARAIQQTAELMQRQAELFEATIKAAREPTELAKRAAGVDRRRKKA